jgi:hypothetical protein
MTRNQFLTTLNVVLLFLRLAANAGAQTQYTTLTSNGQLQDSGQGDLTIQIGCDYTFDGDWVEADLFLKVAGQQVASNHYELYGYNKVGIRADVQASTQNRQVDCTADTTYGTISASGWLLGSGPGSATVKIDTFIPPNWIGHPTNVYRVFGGDDRDFGYYQGSSRVVTVYDVYNPAVNSADVLSGPYHQAGMTQEYDIGTSLDAPPPYGRITGTALNDWTWDNTLKTRWAMADTGGMSCTSPQRLGHPTELTSAHKFQCTAQASDPLLWSPSVRWDLTLTLTWGENKIHYEITGCHSYFPHFEAYVNGASLFQDVGTDNAVDLFYGCAVSVSRSGDIQ